MLTQRAVGRVEWSRWWRIPAGGRGRTAAGGTTWTTCARRRPAATGQVGGTDGGPRGWRQRHWGRRLQCGRRRSGETGDEASRPDSGAVQRRRPSTKLEVSSTASGLGVPVGTGMRIYAQASQETGSAAPPCPQRLRGPCPGEGVQGGSAGSRRGAVNPGSSPTPGRVNGRRAHRRRGCRDRPAGGGSYLDRDALALPELGQSSTSGRNSATPGGSAERPVTPTTARSPGPHRRRDVLDVLRLRGRHELLVVTLTARNVSMPGLYRPRRPVSPSVEAAEGAVF